MRIHPRSGMSTGGALITCLLALAGCGGAKPASKSSPPLVNAVPPRMHLFVDRVEAIGTARANEQVTLAAPVTERIERLYFDDGGYVTRGQIVAVLAQGQEQATLAAARADELQARTQLDRVQALSRQGFATGTTLDQQIAAAHRARSEADNARAQIADRVLRAPFSGYVSLRMISAGAVLGVGAPVATISDISRIKLDFTVPETALAAIRPGQPIVATAAAYPGQPVRGTIETIDPVIDPATRAVMVRAILANPAGRLKPGMLLTVGIEASARSALAVPELAVIGDGETRYVFVVDRDRHARRVTVTTGLRDAGLVEVHGLAADARVITEGVVKVADGQPVRLDGARGAAGASPRVAQR